MRFKILVALAAPLVVIGAQAASAQSSPPARTAPIFVRAAPISVQERQQGEQANAGILQEYGGPYAGPQAAYARQVGQRIAVESGLSTDAGAFNVTLLDSSIDNAFAIPGGFVYVTRDLMALMNDEAELAAVLGHEVAHVAARHSARRQSTATRNSVLGALGQLLVGAVTGNSAIGGLLSRGIGTGAQLATLGFSRSQETEADSLGIRYLTSAGYDPGALAMMLQSLSAQTSLEARIAGTGQAPPAWASTHPDPAARVRRAQTEAAAVRATGGSRNRDAFLTAIDGMVYGENPREGVIEGRRFLHPDLGIAFDVPTGLSIQNGRDAVRIGGGGVQAQFSAGSYSGDISSYLGQVVNKVSGRGLNTTLDDFRRSTINGIPIAATQLRASNGTSPVDVTIFAYAITATQAAHFLVVTAAGQGLGQADPLLSSLRRLTPADRTAIKTHFVRVVTIKAGDTVRSLSARMAYPDLQLERFLVLNALSANTALRPGSKVKLITY